MSLIVEDGTGKSDAESYISVADATAYHAARGNADWAAIATDAIREQLLRKATSYMVGQYRLRWNGYRYTDTQALDWPRAWVPKPDTLPGYRGFPNYYPYNEVPLDVAHACAELALRSNSDDLLADQEQATIRERIGSLEVEYDKNSPQQIRYRLVEAMLQPYLNSVSGMTRLQRA